jgi:hypothetical protein
MGSGDRPTLSPLLEVGPHRRRTWELHPLSGYPRRTQPAASVFQNAEAERGARWVWLGYLTRVGVFPESVPD